MLQKLKIMKAITLDTTPELWQPLEKLSQDTNLDITAIANGIFFAAMTALPTKSAPAPSTQKATA